MPTWRSAEQLLAEEPDDDGPYPMALPGYLTNKILKPMSSHGYGPAAVYRCQAPDPDCQCYDCGRARAKTRRNGAASKSARSPSGAAPTAHVAGSPAQLRG